MKRWYDKYPELAGYLEQFREMSQSRRDKLVKGIVEIVRKSNPTIFEDFLLDFPLDFNRRRWYDKDPYLWLLFNGLAYADIDLLSAVTRYLRENIDS
ncbi:MAG: hypothetical protein GF344_04965 [Chitinivibrionales bacterium]|nr:hypothetical protein [Chitinivibrionales bacterium]MBD3356351.1 hypothetical protein [Chitinivibrionales bacterium]